MAQKEKSGLVGLLEYPTTPLLLERTPKKNNILIGNDSSQIRFAEQLLSLAHGLKIVHEPVDIVIDDMLLGKDEPKLYLVERSSSIDISPSVKNKTGIWSLDLIEKGSAGINAIVRHACRLLDLDKPDKSAMLRVGNELIKDSDPRGRRYLVGDIRAAVWNAVWLLSGPFAQGSRWMNPWENWLLWLPKDVDPRYRLNSLYWTLVQWVFASTGDERGYRKTKGRWDAKEFQKLSLLQLPKAKVYNTLVELSAWKKLGYDPFVCALKVAKIWESK